MKEHETPITDCSSFSILEDRPDGSRVRRMVVDVELCEKFERKNAELRCSAFHEGEISDGWTVQHSDFKLLLAAATRLAHACKHKLPPGHFALIAEEYNAVRELSSSSRPKSTARPINNNMGLETTINPDRYPKQGSYLGRSVEVCFEYDSSHPVRGKVIRDDVGATGLMILQLDNGWVVRSTECQWRPI